MSCEVKGCGATEDVELPTITFPVHLCWLHAEWVLPSRKKVLDTAASGAATFLGSSTADKA